MSSIICPICKTKYTVARPVPGMNRMKCPRCQGTIPVQAESVPPVQQLAPSEPPHSHTQPDAKRDEGTIVSGSVPWQGLNLPPGQRISLVVLEGPDKGKQFTLSKAWTTVGRRDGEILLKDPEVSGTHAVIKVLGGTCRVQDLNSTNGTFVNGRRVEEVPLSHLDELRVGQTRLGVSIAHEITESVGADRRPAPQPTKRQLLLVSPHSALRGRFLPALRSGDWNVLAVASPHEIQEGLKRENFTVVACLLDLALPPSERRAFVAALQDAPSPPPLLGVAGPWGMRDLLAKLEGLEVVGLVDQRWPPDKIVGTVNRSLRPPRPGEITRTPFGEKVTYTCDNRETVGEMTGVAPWGVLIETEEPLQPETETSLLFILPEIPRGFRVKGRVVERKWEEGSPTKGEMEVWFLNLGPQERAQILAFQLMAERHGVPREMKTK